MFINQYLNKLLPEKQDKVSPLSDAVPGMLAKNAPLTFPLLTSSAVERSLSWQVGEILEAIVRSTDSQGSLKIKIDSFTFTARGPKVFQPGQALRLKVIENGKNLVFRIIDAGNTNTKSTGVEILLRHDLPKQGNLQTLVKKLSQLSVKTDTRTVESPLLPKPLISQINATSGVLPRVANLIHPQTLKRVIQDSGLFLEAKLVAKITATDSSTSKSPVRDVNFDLKTNLLRLANVIEQSLKANIRQNKIIPGTSVREVALPVEKPTVQQNAQTKLEKTTFELMEFRNIVEAAISRIQVNQSQAIVSNEQSTPLWVIDLPIAEEQHESVIKLEIQYEDSQNSQANPARKWNLRLSIDIAPLGKINVHLNLLDKDLSSSIWAEQQSTNDLIKYNLPRLKNRLQQAGLNVIALDQHPLGRQNSRDALYPSPLVRTKI